MDSRAVFLSVWMLLSSTSTGIKLDGNGYVDIVIAIGSAVPEDKTLIDKIKDMVTEGSEYLFHALDKKVYFKEATILVPLQWNSKDYSKSRTESYEKAKIRIDQQNPAYGDDPYTNQYGECGSESQYIHFTPNFLINDKLIEPYGTRGRVLVHEWAHLRWGVYDEYSEENPFYHSAGHFEATRCSKNIAGQFMDITTGSLQKCSIDPQTRLPTKGCQFFPNKQQYTNSSIMFLPSLQSVSAFCKEHEHNIFAPNMQNKKCGNKATWTVIFEDSVDSGALRSLKPLQTPPPAPSFKVVQRKHRVVCLVLDVSGSMQGPRILRQQQAATYFLQHIIEDQASVGIVTFSSNANTLSSLNLIDSETKRENLIKKLPSTADGGTYICKGLKQGLKVLEEDNGNVVGDEIIFLTDGEASDNINDCVPSAIQSGAIIHTIAFGDKADKALRVMADSTGGKFIIASDDLLSNQLVDAFSSLTISSGDYTKEPVQLESIGIQTAGWFNGTISVDQTVGTKTSFTINYEKSLPTVYVESPSGTIYNQMQMHQDVQTKTLTLKVTGTAEPGDWKYSILSGTLQSLTMTVSSHAARADVPPVIVKAHMNLQFSDGSKPMMVYAEVSQNYRPVINTEVWATLKSESGATETLQLLDNGAGADVSKDDGVYSRYFTKLQNGRSSLKVRVKNQDGQAKFSNKKRGGALYVPGYEVNGVVKLNPPKPPVTVELNLVGRFTRTATGESFEVAIKGTLPNFPPNKITDLSAEIQKDTVLLTWTAPGADLDQGTANSYEIRWSDDLEMLRFNFSNAHLVNTSAVSPQNAGSTEQHSFIPNTQYIHAQYENIILFFAIQSNDKEAAKSDISNIAQASKILSKPLETPNTFLIWMVIAISVSLAIVIIVIVALTIWAVKQRKLTDS
ncbi:calcium-activated chloride channel regulator 3A-1-like [Xyrauchen texanus]|uniref:calcium-activated chloride channel regulator 3A-1-like n=1 Tax=Xyrauchen texanus TaxID=154827 RepID=UPI0022424B0C|nr:calcium-activated chloride channel regulator 3A-1-like [Xyrauchen texanus]